MKCNSCGSEYKGRVCDVCGYDKYKQLIGDNEQQQKGVYMNTYTLIREYIRISHYLYLMLEQDNYWDYELCSKRQKLVDTLVDRGINEHRLWLLGNKKRIAFAVSYGANAPDINLSERR